MRAKLALKNIYRSWVRSLFIFILLAAVTYSLFSNVMEFVITKRETERVIELYDGVGTLEKDDLYYYSAEVQGTGEYIYTDERVSRDIFTEYKDNLLAHMRYDRIDTADIDKIEVLPYVTYADRRYMTAGVSEDYLRLDSDSRFFYDFTSSYVIEATFDGYYERNGSARLSDFKVLCGPNAEVTYAYQYFILYPVPPAPVYTNSEGETVKSEEWMNGNCLVTDNVEYTEEYMQNLVPGQRYVFIARSTTIKPAADMSPMFYLTDQFAYGWCDGIWSLEGEGENYLETEKFAPLKQYIELVETDMHTFDVVYTRDMDSIRYFNDGTIGIVEGRGLNGEDYANGSNVCVVNHEVARVYGLEIGDTITLDLGNKLFEQYEGIGAIAAVPDRMSTDYTEATLEIVGIYKDTRSARLRQNDPCWSYSLNTIFVPTHLLNVSEEELQNHTFAPGEFSFVIENVYDVELFEKECAGQIESMGYRLTLTDGNWREIEEIYESSQRTALFKIFVLCLAVFATTCFTVMLYILGRRRDFAIMRVLGAAKPKANRALTLPLMVITCSAVIVGMLTAWIITVQNITFDDVMTQTVGFIPDTSVPLELVLVCVAAVILLAFVVAISMLGIIGRKSPLELLQDRSQKKAAKKSRKKNVPAEEPAEVTLGEWVSLEPVKRDGKNRTAEFIRRFVLRNIQRTKGKALMYVLVSALLLNVSGQLAILQQVYAKAFEETEVVSKYAGSLNIAYVSQLQESGYVKDVFYRAFRQVDMDKVMTGICITNDIDRYCEEEVNVTFLEGYDKSIMQTHEPILIMDAGAMRRFGYELGDTVRLSTYGEYDMRRLNMTSYYRYSNSKASGMTDDEVYPYIAQELEKWYQTYSDEFLIVGCTDSAGLNIYTPGIKTLNVAYGLLVVMDMTEATLIDNNLVKEYREYGEELADANRTYEVAFIMDSAEVEHIANNISVLELLYPVAVIAMLVIGIFMTSLIIVQTSKDIAIMRVLGTSKRRTRVIIILERMLLCFAGMVLAAIIMFAMRGVTAAVARKIVFILTAYFAAVIAASAIASMAATRKNVLELLQTKE
ncbi:MAG: hypothetical protein IJ017_01335 [Oscillospiraceae bacterium]|nr:hypothetical protein [Oscillospiraceae bacterium]